MAKFVALYRGINVGGKNSVPMQALRAMHEGLGHEQVQSYIQSGNLVFSATGSAATIAQRTAAEFAATFGFSAQVLVVSTKQWEAMVAGNPYAQAAVENPNTVHAALADGAPSASALTALLKKTAGTERFTVGKGVIYLHAPDGFGKSKFAAGMERAAGVPLTVRNWRTVEAIRELYEG